MKLDPQKTGLALGSFATLIHLVWAFIVAMGLAQSYMDWVYSIHFLNNPFSVTGFSLMTALVLLVVAFIMGFIVGWVFANVWNWVQKS